MRWERPARRGELHIHYHYPSAALIRMAGTIVAMLRSQSDERKGNNSRPFAQQGFLSWSARQEYHLCSFSEFTIAWSRRPRPWCLCPYVSNDEDEGEDDKPVESESEGVHIYSVALVLYRQTYLPRFPGFHGQEKHIVCGPHFGRDLLLLH